VASRDEKILLKLQKENHDLSLLSTEKKALPKKKYSNTKKCNTTLQFIISTVQSRFSDTLFSDTLFSDTLFSDKSRFSDNFAEDHFFSYDKFVFSATSI
jgi:hypothetical protein